MIEIEAMAMSAALEAAVAYLMARLMRWPSRGALHIAAAAAAATAITHPQVWTAALWAFQRFSYWPSVAALEAAVVLAEGLLIAWMAALRVDRAMLVSLLSNSASFLSGLLLQG